MESTREIIDAAIAAAHRSGARCIKISVAGAKLEVEYDAGAVVPPGGGGGEREASRALVGIGSLPPVQRRTTMAIPEADRYRAVLSSILKERGVSGRMFPIAVAEAAWLRCFGEVASGKKIAGFLRGMGFRQHKTMKARLWLAGVAALAGN